MPRELFRLKTLDPVLAKFQNKSVVTIMLTLKTFKLRNTGKSTVILSWIKYF